MVSHVIVGGRVAPGSPSKVIAEAKVRSSVELTPKSAPVVPAEVEAVAMLPGAGTSVTRAGLAAVAAGCSRCNPKRRVRHGVPEVPQVSLSMPFPAALIVTWERDGRGAAEVDGSDAISDCSSTATVVMSQYLGMVQ